MAVSDDVFQALKVEIVSDPLGRGYAGMTDQQVADSLNAMNRPGAVPMSALINEFLYADKFALLEEKAVVGATETERLAARRMLIWIREKESVDLTIANEQSSINAALNALVSVAFITQGQKDALIAKVTNPKTRWEELGYFQPMTAAFVAELRAA